jgi:hypothetical protein
MRFSTGLSVCALLLPSIQCSGEAFQGEHEGELALATGPYDPDDGPPNCGEDGICRINECTNDPDCDLPEPPDPPDPVTYSLTGSVTVTSVSGVEGSHVHTLGSPNSTQKAVYAILSLERNNHPCYVAIGTEDVNDETIDTAPLKDHCGENGPTSSYLHADYLDTNAGGSDDHIFIKGVQVCMNGDDDKVKGISVVGTKLTSTGSLVSMTAITDDRTNCDHWDNLVLCPVGQVATAVDVHFATGDEPNDVIGLALHCRTVID